MPRNTDYDAIRNAYYAVKNGEMLLATAARLYGVCDRTVARRLRDKVPLNVEGPGPSPLLSEEEELKLADHISKLTSYGYCLNIQEVIALASDYAVSLGKRTPDKKPLSTRWYYKTVARKPQLKNSKPQSLEVYRAKAASKENVARYFQNLKKSMEDAGVTDKPHRIYNVDEIGLTAHCNPKKIICSKWTNCVENTQPKQNVTTVIGCGNAVGYALPPYFVFAGIKVRDSFLNKTMPGTAATTSKSGWGNSKVFRFFLKKHFFKFAKPTADEPVLLIYNGHKSHVNIAITDWATTNNIHLFLLPAHTSHFLQPLDVACFGPLGTLFSSSKDQLLKSDKKELLSNREVCTLACKAYQEGLNTINLVSGFSKTGIFPMVGLEAIPADTMLTPSIPFDPTREKSEETTEVEETQATATQVDM